MKNVKKFRLRVLLSFCLIFCQFQPDVAYKSVAYKKVWISINQIVQKQPFEDIFKSRCSEKFRNIHEKTPVLESLFSKIGVFM